MESIAAESVMVIVLCRDGKLRQAPLTTKQAAKVRRTVSHLHGGDIRLNPEEILVMSEADALEAFGKLTGKLPLRERLWKRFEAIRQRFAKPPPPPPNPRPRNERTTGAENEIIMVLPGLPGPE